MHEQIYSAVLSAELLAKLRRPRTRPSCPVNECISYGRRILLPSQEHLWTCKMSPHTHSLLMSSPSSCFSIQGHFCLYGISSHRNQAVEDVFWGLVSDRKNSVRQWAYPCIFLLCEILCKPKLPFQAPWPYIVGSPLGFLLVVAKVNFSSKTNTEVSRVSTTLWDTKKECNWHLGSGFKCWQTIYPGDRLLAFVFPLPGIMLCNP